MVLHHQGELVYELVDQVMMVFSKLSDKWDDVTFKSSENCFATKYLPSNPNNDYYNIEKN